MATCALTDRRYDGQNNPIVGAVILTQPTLEPLFLLEADGSLREVSPPWPSGITDATGQYTLNLPYGNAANQDPSTNLWKILIDDGTVWQGLVPAQPGPFTIEQLKNATGTGVPQWGVVTGPAAAAPPVQAIQGPAGTTIPTGTAGGDLGGTYPNPTVTGVTHLSGTLPTTVAVQDPSLSSNVPLKNAANSFTSTITVAGLVIGPAGSTGAPSAGTWAKGALSVDAAGSVFVCTAAGTPGTWLQLIVTSDARLSDARTPTTHASTHLPNGSDAIDWAGTIHQAGTHAGRPAASAGTTGCLYFETDTTSLFRSNGSGWTLIASVGGGGGGSGTVSSVAMTVPSDLAVSGSPITTTGTFAVTRTTQTANTVLAGPTTGAAAGPTYRAIVAADLPTPWTKAQQHSQTAYLDASETFAGTLTGSSGSAAHLTVATTVTQSGTAGYSALEIDVTETATGSGAKYLINIGVSGGQRWQVDSNGTLVSGIIPAGRITGTITPSSAAGGDLAGTYPTPTLDPTKAHAWTGLQTMGAGLRVAAVVKTANSTITTSDVLITVDAANTTQTIPDPTSCTGQLLIIKNSPNGTGTLVTPTAGTIDGLTAYSGLAAANAAATFISDGTAWRVV